MLSQCHAWEPCCEHWSIVVEAVLAIMSLAIWLYVITTYRFCACTCNMMYSFHYYVDLASWVAWPLASPPKSALVFAYSTCIRHQGLCRNIGLAIRRLKILKICLLVLTEFTNVTDGHTHTHRQCQKTHDGMGRACIASHGKNLVIS